jgi:hypothetical protein
MGRRTKEEKSHWHVTPLRRNSDMRGVWVNHIAMQHQLQCVARYLGHVGLSALVEQPCLTITSRTTLVACQVQTQALGTPKRHFPTCD